MIEPIICPLWVSSADRFVSRRYHAWDRPCRLCGRKVVVSDSIKRQLESNNECVLVCEQCALVRSSEIEALLLPEPKADLDGACPTCASLKKQEETAAMELAQIRGLPGSADVQRKWEHLFT